MEMNFKNVWDIIEEVEAHRENSDAWIFDNGKIKDDIITCDIIKFLNGYCDNAIDTCSEVFANIKGMSYNFENFKPYNNYNQNGNSSEVIEYHTYEDDWDFYVAISVHIGRDVRIGYTDFVLFRFDSFEEFYDALDQTYIIEEENFSASVSVNALIENCGIYVNYINDKGDEDYFDFEDYGCEREDIAESIRVMISELKSKKEN